MKKLLLIIAAVSFISLGAEAQQERKIRERMTPEKVAEKMTERMTKELGLSEEQKKEVYVLHLESTSKRAEEMKAQREKMKANHKAQQEKFEAILSPEQKAAWEAKRSEVREKRNQPREGKKKFDRKARRQHNIRG